MQIISKEAFNFKEQLRNFKRTHSVVLCGLFVALYVVLSFFSIKVTAYIEFRFAFLALVAAAAYGGPLMGAFTGMAGDIISYFVTPQNGAFFPGFTLSYLLLGFCFGLVLYRAKPTIVRSICTAIIYFIEACTLTTIWLHFMYGMDWQYLFTIRLLKSLVSLVINSVLVYVFMAAFSQVLKALRLQNPA